MSNPLCIVMVKAPQAGAVKTRLAPPLSGADAAGLAACFAQDVVTNARLAVPQVCVAYTPADGLRTLEKLLPHDDLLWHEQRGADLGARMIKAAHSAAANRYGPIVIIGTDSPTFPPAAIETAIQSLSANESDVALAPTDDGGYCLIGFRQYPNHLFQNIHWSTPLAYQQTASNAARLNLRLLALPQWYDVDTYSDLLRLREEIFSDKAARERASSTSQWLLTHHALFPKTN